MQAGWVQSVPHTCQPAAGEAVAAVRAGQLLGMHSFPALIQGFCSVTETGGFLLDSVR